MPKTGADEPHEHLERTLEKIRQAVRSVVQLAEVQQQYKQSSNRANGSRANSENWRKCSPAVRIDRIIDKLPTV